MLANDPLLPILNNPYLTAGLVLILGLVTLLIAVRFNLTAITSNKAFLIGDLVVLPISGGVISVFYNSVVDPKPTTSETFWNIGAAAVAVLITLGFGYRYKLFQKRWVGHGIFFVFFAYIFINFFTKGLFQILNTGSLNLIFLWLVGVGLVVLHLAVGAKWPKKF